MYQFNREEYQRRMAWYTDARFGMFIHWGLYSIPAWHEQILWRGKTKRRDYEQLIHQFNPTNYDPDAWVAAAKEAFYEVLDCERA